MSSARIALVAALFTFVAPAVASADRLTVRGTQVFKSVVPDTPTQYGKEFVAFNGFLYFVANDDVRGNELWRTDGTRTRAPRSSRTSTPAFPPTARPRTG